jgi:hypothetical protein
MASANRREHTDREQPDVRDAETVDISSRDGGDVTEPVQPAVRRTKFFLEPRDLPWLPVSEPAFLLWVLAALVLIWIGIALGLRIA